jgi:hypothetical protein
MSEPNSRLSQLPVSRIRVAGATSMSERHLVYCQRRSPESTSLTRAAAVMAFEGVSCLIVLSPAATVVGVLTAADLLGWLAMADGYLPRARSSVAR